MKEKPGFVLYNELTDAITTAFTDDDEGNKNLGVFFRAMYNYHRYGVIPEFDNPHFKEYWVFARKALDHDTERYETKQRARKKAAYIMHGQNKVRVL